MPPSVVVEIHQDETLTGEAVALDVQPVGLILRAAGAAIDAVAGIALLILFSLLLSWLVGVGAVGEELVPALSISLVVLVLVVIPIAVETLSHGRSLGRLAVGGRIVRADGGAAGFRHAFLRAFVGVIELWITLGSVAVLVAAFSPRAQRLGDLLAGTYSERTRTPALPAGEPVLPPALVEWAGVADVARLPDRLAERLSRFVRQAASMQPDPRARLAAELGAQARSYVSPVPPVDADTFVRGVVAVRRERELRALRLTDERVGALVSGVERPLR